jgi:hypothetical protein
VEEFGGHTSVGWCQPRVGFRSGYTESDGRSDEGAEDRGAEG